MDDNVLVLKGKSQKVLWEYVKRRYPTMQLDEELSWTYNRLYYYTESGMRAWSGDDADQVYLEHPDARLTILKLDGACLDEQA